MNKFSTAFRISTKHLEKSAILCAMELTAAHLMDSPIGRLVIGATELGIAELQILEPGQLRAAFSSSELAERHISQATAQLQEFFNGQRSSFDLPIDIRGTDFQVAVWDAIGQLDKGEALTYGELADRIGKPGAARAVGGAVGANPLPLIIGCHRVLGAKGAVTGYSGGGGLKTKKWLLEFEGISYLP